VGKLQCSASGGTNFAFHIESSDYIAEFDSRYWFHQMLWMLYVLASVVGLKAGSMQIDDCLSQIAHSYGTGRQQPTYAAEMS